MSFLDSLEPPSGAFGDLFRFPKRQFAKSQTSLDEAVIFFNWIVFKKVLKWLSNRYRPLQTWFQKI